MWFAIAVPGSVPDRGCTKREVHRSHAENLAQFDSAKTVEDFNRVANTFERIGDAESQWLPLLCRPFAVDVRLDERGW